MPCGGCGDSCKCSTSQCCQTCKCDESCSCTCKKSPPADSNAKSAKK